MSGYTGVMSNSTTRTPDPLGSIDSTELRILHALATTGSLTAAAASLGLSQPAVSQRIKRVETRLAVPLIERSGRGIRLTPAGRILADHGRTVVAEIDAALSAIDDLRGERAGTLRLVGFPSASATVVPALMRALATEAPDVALQYREAEPPAATEMLRDGEVDCALIFDYEGAAELPAGSAFLPLWREEVRLVLSDEGRVIGERLAAARGLLRRALDRGLRKVSWSPAVRSAAMRALSPTSSRRPTTSPRCSRWPLQAVPWPSCRGSPSPQPGHFRMTRVHSLWTRRATA